MTCPAPRNVGDANGSSYHDDRLPSLHIHTATTEDVSGLDQLQLPVAPLRLPHLANPEYGGRDRSTSPPASSLSSVLISFPTVDGALGLNTTMTSSSISYSISPPPTQYRVVAPQDSPTMSPTPTTTAQPPMPLAPSSTSALPPHDRPPSSPPSTRDRKLSRKHKDPSLHERYVSDEPLANEVLSTPRSVVDSGFHTRSISGERHGARQLLKQLY